MHRASRRSLSFLFASFLLFLAASSAPAKPVGVEAARRVAIAQYRATAPFDPARSLLGSAPLSLAYRQRAPAASPADTATLYYVFNAPEALGFVIVAGDDAVEPVLGYSNEGSFSLSNPSPEFLWWMSRYERQITAAIRQQLTGSPRTQQLWRELAGPLPASLPRTLSKGSAAVGPLLATRWNQSPYYNALCPFDRSAGERTVTGCVATAIAQIMKYHRSPEQGNGDHGYSHERYGYLYANFANATYNWDAMPNRVTALNEHVARLMYHVGVSCDMEYGPSLTGGSGAYPKNAAAALVRYFDYRSTTRVVERDDYSNDTWISMIRGELDNGRPLEYHGFGDGSGHSFVCDGYDGSYFHMNWGWDGQYNGFFLLSDLVPAGVGAGGGNGSYNDAQGAIIGIAPESPVPGQASIELAAELTINPNPVSANGVLTVEFNLYNSGTTGFSGAYCAALFNAEGNFVKYLEIWSGQHLQAGYRYTNGLETTDTLFGEYPGTYYVGIYARPENEEWSIVAAGSYQNLQPFSIEQTTYPSLLSVYKAPGTTPEQVNAGAPFRLHTDFANFSESGFEGEIGVWAYTSNGRSMVAQIDIQSDLVLGSGNHWVDGLTFSCSGLDVEPGRYMLAFFEREQGGDWQFINPGNYINPVFIDVLPGLLSADQYEQNDAPGTAYPLAISLAGGSAIVRTPGSNIHVKGNRDYYRIDLPAGYQYDVSASIHDSWTDEAGGYTNDVGVMVNTGGDAWSDVYDDSTDVLPVSGGRSVLFKVQSLYLWTIGTYRLDIRVTRRTSGVDEPDRSPHAGLLVYPVPASSELYVQSAPSHGLAGALRLVDATGRTVASLPGLAAVAGPFRFDLSGIPSGTYTLVVDTGHGPVTRRVVVQR